MRISDLPGCVGIFLCAHRAEWEKTKIWAQHRKKLHASPKLQMFENIEKKILEGPRTCVQEFLHREIVFYY